MQPRRPKHLHSNSFLGRNACGRGMQTSPTIDPRVRRYGNRKERLKEETKGEEGEIWGKYEACLGNSEIIAPYSKYKGEGGAVSTSVYTSYAKCFAPHSAPLHPFPLSLHAQLFRVFPLDGMHQEYYRTPESTDKRSRVNERRFSSGFYRYICTYIVSRNTSCPWNQLTLVHRLEKIRLTELIFSTFEMRREGENS